MHTHILSIPNTTGGGAKLQKKNKIKIKNKSKATKTKWKGHGWHSKWLCCVNPLIFENGIQLPTNRRNKWRTNLPNSSGNNNKRLPKLPNDWAERADKRYLRQEKWPFQGKRMRPLIIPRQVWVGVCATTYLTITRKKCGKSQKGWKNCQNCTKQQKQKSTSINLKGTRRKIFKANERLSCEFLRARVHYFHSSIFLFIFPTSTVAQLFCLH